MEIENQSIEPEITTNDEIETNDEIVNNDETGIEQDGEITPEKQAPEFKPNYAYKAYGKDLEVDEWARPLINAENNEQFTKLYARAGGFDVAKEKLEAERARNEEIGTQFSGIQSQFNDIVGQRDRLVKSVEMGNFRETFNILGLNEDKLLDYAENLAAIKMGDHTRKESFEQKYNQMTNSMESEFQQQAFQQERQEFMIQQHEFEVTQTFQRPDVSPLIEEYNTRMNDPNAFRSVVEQIGLNEYHASEGRNNISVMEAVDRAKSMLGLGLQQANSVAPINQNAQQNVNNSQINNNQQPPQAIPDFGGSGAITPVRKTPRSLEELEAHTQELYG